MVTTLNRILHFLITLSAHNRKIKIQQMILKNQLDRMNEFDEIMQEINEKIDLINPKNTENIAESMIVIRSKLLDCQTRFEDLIEIIEQVIHQASDQAE